MIPTTPTATSWQNISAGDIASTSSSASASPGTLHIEHTPVVQAPQLDGPRELSDKHLVLGSDQVRANEGGIFQVRDYVCLLIGQPQQHGQILVSPIAANPQAGEAGVVYHMTVPPRYQDLGLMREAYLPR